MKKKRYFSRGVMFVLCLVFAVAFLLPTVLTITNSFMSEAEIKANYGMIFSTTSGGYVSKTVNLKFIPDKVTLSQYITGLVKSPDYLLKFWNSIILVVPIVILQVAIASVAAYSFTRWRGKIRSGIFFFYVILMLMPYQVTLVPNYLVSEWLGILNTRWSIILPGMFAPFSVFLLTKFMRRIPYSLIEAAKVDGANRWKQMRYITLPGLLPTFIVLFMLSISNILNNGMEQYMVFQNSMNKNTIEVLDLYVYNITIASKGTALYSFATAIGILKTLVSVTLLFSANFLSKKLRGESIV